MKENKGITLIALVITIIVLLILAGISLAMLSGNNGLLTRASSTSQKTVAGEAKEVVGTSISAVYTTYLKDHPTAELNATSVPLSAIITEVNATTGTTVAEAQGSNAIKYTKTGSDPVYVKLDVDSLAILGVYSDSSLSTEIVL